MRLLDRLLGLAIGVALTTIGVVAVAELILDALGRRPWLLTEEFVSQLEQIGLERLAAQAILVVGVLLGLALFLLAAWPRGARTVPLRNEPRRRGGVDRRSLESHLVTLAGTDEDVARARVRIRGARARLRLELIRGSDRRATRRRVREAAKSELTAIGVRRPRRVRVRSQIGKQRVR